MKKCVRLFFMFWWQYFFKRLTSASDSINNSEKQLTLGLEKVLIYDNDFRVQHFSPFSEKLLSSYQVLLNTCMSDISEPNNMGNQSAVWCTSINYYISFDDAKLWNHHVLNVIQCLTLSYKLGEQWGTDNIMMTSQIQQKNPFISLPNLRYYTLV